MAFQNFVDKDEIADETATGSNGQRRNAFGWHCDEDVGKKYDALRRTIILCTELLDTTVHHESKMKSIFDTRAFTAVTTQAVEEIMQKNAKAHDGSPLWKRKIPISTVRKIWREANAKAQSIMKQKGANGSAFPVGTHPELGAVLQKIHERDTTTKQAQRAAKQQAADDLKYKKERQEQSIQRSKQRTKSKTQKAKSQAKRRWSLGGG